MAYDSNGNDSSLKLLHIRKFARMARDYKMLYLNLITEGTMPSANYQSIKKQLKDKKAHRSALDLDFAVIKSS